MDKNISKNEAQSKPSFDKSITNFSVLAAKDAVKALPKELEQDFLTKKGLEKTAGLVLSTGAMGAVMDFLPGPLKAVAGVGMLAGFGYAAAKPLYESGKAAYNAKNEAQFKNAANDFGSTVTSTAISFGIGAGSYKLGSLAMDSALGADTSLALKDSIDTKFKLALHDTKAKVFGSNLSDINVDPLKSIAETGSGASHLTRIAGTSRATINGEILDAVKDDEMTSATLFLKTTTPKNESQLISDVMSGKRAPLSDSEYRQLYQVKTADLATVRDFAREHNLNLDLNNWQDGYVKVQGKVADMKNAFNTKFVNVKNAQTGEVFQTNIGDVQVPAKVANSINSIVGLDGHQVASTHFRVLDQSKFGDLNQAQSLQANVADGGGGGKPASRFSGYTGADVAKAAHTPDTETLGAGRSAVILELGGAVNPKDMSYFTDNGLKNVPSIVSKAIDGAQIQSDGPNGADGEVALDYQNIGMAAPNAKQTVVFAPNNDQGMPDVLLYSAKAKPDVVSISWGSPESNWTQSAVTAMDNAAKQNVLKGVNIFAASGDNGSGDGVGDGQPHADYPASSSYITGTGGLRQTIKGGETVSETVWNDGSQGGAGGGAPSNLFPTPDFQQGVAQNITDVNGNPLNARGVPDVSGNADPQSGFKVQVDGQKAIIGGTSAEAPMYSARWMRIKNAFKAQTGQELTGDYKSLLYKAYADNSGVVRDITQGNNDENGDIGGFNAGPGYDLASGLGDVRDDQFLDWLVKNHPNANKTIGSRLSTLTGDMFGDNSFTLNDRVNLNAKAIADSPLFGGMLGGFQTNLEENK